MTVSLSCDDRYLVLRTHEHYQLCKLKGKVIKWTKEAFPEARIVLYFNCKQCQIYHCA